MVSKQILDRPFQQVAADFASFGGKQFLILVDCKTDWSDIIETGKDTTVAKLFTSLQDYFCHTAAHDLLWSDGGPQFTSHQFADFLQTWGVTHVTSSHLITPRAMAKQVTMKSIGKLISAAWTSRSVNWDQLSHELLQYRNISCRKDGLSPAQKLFGHPVQDTHPTQHRFFAPEWQRSS